MYKRIVDLFLKIRGHATARCVVRQTGQKDKTEKMKSLHRALKTLN